VVLGVDYPLEALSLLSSAPAFTKELAALILLHVDLVGTSLDAVTS
jgi:hypothetical protein